MEPTRSLRSIEIALRLVISAVLGDNWPTSRGAPPREELVERQTEETKRRDGAQVSKDLLDYTQTHHLKAIIEKNWESFKPVFNDKTRTVALLEIVLDFRNSIAHSRELLPFEHALLAGIAGQLRNQVSLFRATTNESSRYYPLIELAVDGFGTHGIRPGAAISAPRKLRLNVGDTLEFSGRAFNSRGSRVRWKLAFGRHYGMSLPHDEVHEVASGDDVTFIYEITERDVGEVQHANVFIVSDERFHRHPEGIQRFAYDDTVSFTYAINPPAD